MGAVSEKGNNKMIMNLIITNCMNGGFITFIIISHGFIFSTLPTLIYA